VAGDFNPVLPSDDTLVGDNDLVDAWTELHPEEPGFTWGVDGKEPFPPNRMDRVATLGLAVHDIEVLHPGSIRRTAVAVDPRGESASLNRAEMHEGEDVVPWSDHSGLKCSFSV
jgi:tyrosyl-DNA phosphodiesterase 2